MFEVNAQKMINTFNEIENGQTSVGMIFEKEKVKIEFYNVSTGLKHKVKLAVKSFEV